MTRTSPIPSIVSEVVVGGIRTPFGRAGEKGNNAGTRAGDLAAKGIATAQAGAAT